VTKGWKEIKERKTVERNVIGWENKRDEEG
jgi:hypothetical protein